MPDQTDVTDVLEQALPSGVVFRPGTPEYGDATTPDNSSYPQHPLAVVRPRSAEDVATVVTLAAQGGKRVAVQATGHGAGEPIGDDIVLIDTSALQSTSIDADRRVARVGAGAQWGRIQAAAEPHGLLGLSGTSPSVAVAGYVVNGGVGWLVRRHGLASATLRSVEFVDGQGTVRRAGGDDSDPSARDALWAFRGGAPVGVATELEFDLAAVPDLWAGYLIWPGEHLAALAAAWLDSLPDAPSGLSSDLSLLHLPPAGPFPDELLGTVCVVLSYASLDGEAALAPMRATLCAVATPAIDTTAMADAAALAGVHLDPPSAVPGRGDGAWLETPDADQLLDVFEAAGIGAEDGLNMIELRHVALADPSAAVPDGALTRVPAPFLLHAVGGGPDEQSRSRTDARLAGVEAAAESLTIGLSTPAFRDGLRDAGDAHPAEVTARLLEIAGRLDPDGVFAFQRSVASRSR